jgi:hypothetical protein
MLTSETSIEGDELFDRPVVGLARDRRELDLTFDDGVGKEVLARDVQRGPRLAQQVLVLGAVCRYRDPDQAIVRYEVPDVGKLGSSICANGDEHRPATSLRECQCFSKFHEASLAPLPAYSEAHLVIAEKFGSLRGCVS